MLYPQVAWTQLRDDSTAIDLDVVTVSAGRIAYSAKETQAIYHYNLDQAYSDEKSLYGALTQIPGMTVFSSFNFAQDIRISFRGFGNRSAFGIRGIKVVIDGIPATTPDGQSQLDHLDITRLSQITVAGSTASIYGNASGGTIELETFRPVKSGWQAGIIAGAHNYQKAYMRRAFVGKQITAEGGIGYTHLRGFRQHSAMQQFNMDASLSRKYTWGNITARLNYTHSPYAEDPGSLDAASVTADFRRAREENVSYDAGESIQRGSISVSLLKRINTKNTLSSTAYYVLRDFANRLPFAHGGAVAYFRNYVGLQSKWAHTGKNSTLQVGVDVEHQNDDRKRNINNKGEKGATVFSQVERFFLTGVYARYQHTISRRLTFDLGLRADIMHVSANDQWHINGDQSGNKQWVPVNPSAGIHIKINPYYALFLRHARSFETPTLNELTNNPDGQGGFNPDLKPQTASHWEIGIKGKYAKSHHQFTVFKIDLRNEIVPYELDIFPGKFFYRNAGKTERYGVEYTANILWSEQLQTRFSYTYMKNKYVSYLLNGVKYNGNNVPGSPNHFGYAGIAYTSNSQWQATLGWRYTGKLYADDRNTTLISDYITGQLRLGKKWATQKITLTAFGGINNILNQKYFDNIRINAFGKRYYEAAPRRHFYLGITADL